MEEHGADLAVRAGVHGVLRRLAAEARREGRQDLVADRLDRIGERRVAAAEGGHAEVQEDGRERTGLGAQRLEAEDGREEDGLGVGDGARRARLRGDGRRELAAHGLDREGVPARGRLEERLELRLGFDEVGADADDERRRALGDAEEGRALELGDLGARREEARQEARVPEGAEQGADGRRDDRERVERDLLEVVVEDRDERQEGRRALRAAGLTSAPHCCTVGEERATTHLLAELAVLPCARTARALARKEREQLAEERLAELLVLGGSDRCEPAECRDSLRARDEASGTVRRRGERGQGG